MGKGNRLWLMPLTAASEWLFIPLSASECRSVPLSASECFTHSLAVADCGQAAALQEAEAARTASEVAVEQVIAC